MKSGSMINISEKQQEYTSYFELYCAFPLLLKY